ncbi:MAG: rod shape-determining protein MreC [Candidatus Sulfotelmatobacter sp.]|jgi:rod shape-determining protein MreC
MESVLGRYRNLTILVGVLFLQVLGLAVQVKRSGEAENTRLIRIWAVDMITPFERVLVWAQNSSGNLWHDYFFLRGVRAENRQLKQQIDQMRLEQVRLSEDAEQAQRLQKLLAFKEQVIAKTVPAQVIGSSGSDLSRSIYIDKGSNEGVAPDMAVITSGGIVGKVLRVYPSTALVLMINDQTSGVGAMLEKTRLQGVLKGTADGSVVLERVMSDEKVVPGDTVLSSGGDQIFPKGLPVGTVAKVSPGHEMFLNIVVKPAADLNRLEEVLVVTEKQEQNAVVEGNGRVRAADILAQRLPSVPDKPADTATTRNKIADSTTAKPSTPAANTPALAIGATKPATSQQTQTVPPISKPTGTAAAPVPSAKKKDSQPAASDVSNPNRSSVDTAGSNAAASRALGTPQAKPPNSQLPTQTPASEDATH